MNATTTWDDWSCYVRLTVTNPSVLEAARQQLTDLMADVERCSSRFVATSDISRVNEAPGRLLPVSRRTVALVDVALNAASKTSGLVDPTVGAHVIRAGYDGDISTVRGHMVETPVGVPPRRADWQRVQVDRDLGRVGVPAGLVLDLGATAKAWTADTAAHTISTSLNTGVLVEIGGDVAVAGHKQTPWQVHVSETAGQAGEQVGLTTGGLATSSSAARTWTTPAGPAHHIIDPRTGAPANGPWRTVTVWAPSAVDANTASTAAIVLGADALDYLVDLNLPARLVSDQGLVRTVGAWPAESRAA